jgi:hypothetical protein
MTHELYIWMKQKNLTDLVATPYTNDDTIYARQLADGSLVGICSYETQAKFDHWLSQHPLLKALL